MTWQDVYRQPFHCDPYGIYIFSGPEDDCSVTALQCITDDTGVILTSLCNFLNHKVDTFQPTIKTIIKYDGDCSFILETEDVIEVRGWGYLTGVLHLSFEEAAKIQDDFLEYVINRINTAQDITGLYQH